MTLGARLEAALAGAHGSTVAVDDASPTSPAALLAEARRLQAAWHAAGLKPGDRVVVALPAGPAFVAALVAAFVAELTLAPAPAVADAAACDAVAAALDARAVLAADGAHGVRLHDVRRAHGPPSRDVRLLLRTSGTSGAARWIACSERNLVAVLDSHAAPLARAGATVLSVLPWHHAFGLVIQLLPALLAGAALVCDARGGRDTEALLALAARHRATHLDAVPLTVRRLAEGDAGRALLAALAGGVVGGAPVDAALAALLAGTRLRVGYGQTEASPGILLGAPGAWRAATLGRPLVHPLACEIRLHDDGELAFRGPNAALGEWRSGEGLVRHDASRWVHTGDLARHEDDGTYTFEGRRADAFKLANGRYVGAGALERVLRARLPGLAEAMLSSPDGERLLLACTPAGGAVAPTAAEVRPLLGPLAARPLDVVVVAEGAWMRTPKGELDRRWPAGAARTTPG